MKAFQDALDDLQPHQLTDDEAAALLDMFPEGEYSGLFELEWSLLHAIESAPYGPDFLAHLDDRSWWALSYRSSLPVEGPPVNGERGSVRLGCLRARRVEQRPARAGVRWMDDLDRRDRRGMGWGRPGELWGGGSVDDHRLGELRGWTGGGSGRCARAPSLISVRGQGLRVRSHEGRWGDPRRVLRPLVLWGSTSRKAVATGA